MPALSAPRTVAGLAAVLVLVAGAGHWVTRPTAYPSRSGASLSAPLPPPGGTLLAGLGLRPVHGSVVLESVTPLLSRNTAGARVRVLVCDRPQGGNPPGVVLATAREYCGRPAPVTGYVQHAISGGTDGPTAQDRDGHVVVEVTPTRAGEVVLRGARVRYRDGLQRGTQVYGVALAFTRAPG